jgi:hypothetical protein
MPQHHNALVWRGGEIAAKGGYEMQEKVQVCREGAVTLLQCAQTLLEKAGECRCVGMPEGEECPTCKELFRLEEEIRFLTRKGGKDGNDG